MKRCGRGTGSVEIKNGGGAVLVEASVFAEHCRAEAIGLQGAANAFGGGDCIGEIVRGEFDAVGGAMDSPPCVQRRGEERRDVERGCGLRGGGEFGFRAGEVAELEGCEAACERSAGTVERASANRFRGGVCG